jgi:hypothetical protein
MLEMMAEMTLGAWFADFGRDAVSARLACSKAE